MLLVASSMFLFIAWSSELFADNWLWQYSGTDDGKIYICNGSDCTFSWGIDAVKDSLNGQVSDVPFSEYIQSVIWYFLWFVSVVAVIYIIWAWFNVLTGNWDEEKLKSARRTIVFVALGIIIMWLAYAIVRFIMNGIIDRQPSSASTQIGPNTALNWIIPSANAEAYTENQIDTFAQYKAKVQVAIEELETELRINKEVQPSSLQNLKQLVQQAADRLPDKDPTTSAANESAKRAIDMYIGIALKDPKSTQWVGDAISQTANFINGAKIETVQWSIGASPLEGNAPLTTSFRAQNVKDPSGTIPPANNYIWWVRENWWVRKELGRGPTLTQTFTKEWSYTVNLDVISASRNSKGKTDILPLSTSVQVEVKPKLGEVILLINWVNVSNQQTFKISPTVANQGIIFDASASRAIGNGVITETTWDFWNGNKRTYKWKPVIEREIYATKWNFPVKLQFKTNDGQTFSQDIQLIIIDPAATIWVDKTTTHVWEAVSFRAETQLADQRNVEYIWQIQDDNGKRSVKSGNWLAFSHTFEAIGTYIVTLTAKSANGGIDTDSKVITVESREPIATLDVPKQLSTERPNTFIFDASRSYDPDTNSKNWLTYTWRIDEQKVNLEDTNENWSKGALTFNSLWSHTVSVTVANAQGKISTATQNFQVTSTLAGTVIVTPQVTQVGKAVTFIANTQNADFYEWNFGDGSAVESGNSRSIQHTYKNTGTYGVTLTIRKNSSSEATIINRKVYVTNMDAPFSMITVTNWSNSTIIEPGVCNWQDAYVLNRAESSTFDGSKSINVDGSNSNLDYTWKYMGKVSTNQTISWIYKEIGCFPIELTVRSKTNGAKHTSVQYVKFVNQAPTLTNITTTIDANKKDSQKVIVHAVANGATDPDGVITSYVWYYTTESDPEPQSIQITQNPQMTFVLPNITEKYYFGVILEDNDWTRVNSSDLFQNKTPLLIDNANGNTNMPLITLNVPKKTVKAGEKVRFTVDAKTIMGTNITNKSQYAWDFDGDGKVDDKGTNPNWEYTYTKAGDYNMKVRVTNNWVSNTKYYTISVRNELKASYIGYKLPWDKLYLMNTSQGVYDTTQWTLGSFTSTQPEGVLVDFANLPKADEKWSIGKLTITNSSSEVSSADIVLKDLSTIETGSGINIQTYPILQNDTIHITDASQNLKISLLGNTATSYAIDSDTESDSDLDGVPDNDIDNKSSASYQNWTAFTIADFWFAKKRNRTVKVTLYNGSTPIATKNINLVLDFIPEAAPETQEAWPNLSSLGDFDKGKLEELATLVRALPDAERIIIMKKYNTLVENWDSTFEKAKNLLDIQVDVNNSTNIGNEQKNSISSVIDALLVGDAQTTDQITIATKLIRDLIPEKSANYKTLTEKIDAIASHPSNIEENKKLWKEILALVQNDPTIEDQYKIHIRNQLLLITSQPVPNDQVAAKGATSSVTKDGLVSKLLSILKVLGIILGSILGLLLIAYIIFRMGRKDGDSGFQDYIIDKIAHRKKEPTDVVETTTTTTTTKTSPVANSTPTTTTTTPENTTTTLASTNLQEEDPLKKFIPPKPVDTTTTSTTTQTTTAANPITEAPMPDWLNPTKDNTSTTTQKETSLENSTAQEGIIDPLAAASNESILSAPSSENTISPDPLVTSTWDLPDWLKPASGDTTTKEVTTAESSDPLKISDTTNTLEEAPISYTAEIEKKQAEKPSNPTTENTYTSNELPDWLKPTSGDVKKVENITWDVGDNTGNSSLSSWDNESTDSTEDTFDDNLPDWLRTTPRDNTSEIENGIDSIHTSDTTTPSTETIDTESSLTESSNLWSKSTDPAPASDELPDWLISAADTTTNPPTTEPVISPAEANIDTISPEPLPTENSIEPMKEKKTVNEKKTHTKKITTTTPSKKNSKKSPETRKTQTVSPSKKTSDTTSQQKPEADISNLPDWLK